LRWSFDTGERSPSQGDDASSGFPGWHIECSAMSAACLGDQIDIHTGGEDNIFPHHECEIAQSECATGKKPFVRLWLHRRRIDIGDQKMSKSLGNVISVPHILAKGFSAQDLRFYLLSVHYRTSLKFTEKGLEDAHKARKKIMEWISDVENSSEDPSEKNPAAKSESCTIQFRTAMDADLNTPAALAAVFDCIAQWRSGLLVKRDALAFINLLKKTFGCFEAETESIPPDVQKLIAERKEARAAKNFLASDRLRDAIHALGYEVRDNGNEQIVKKR
jgi:cysteinyl-tRNA synthetase